VIPRVTLTAVTSDETDLVGNASSRIGTTLHGKYEINQVLGIGGMGVVYAATHRNGKRFAIKLLHPELSRRKDIRTRFLREGYVANAVNHPGVVSVLDDDVAEDGSAFLVMELLDGNTVEALGARPGSRLPLREALGIAYQLLDVLDAAHTKTIVHRDIKPANLFVLRDGQVKVLDFGLARLRDATTSLETTRTGEQMGTPAFMAPEQARGDVKKVDSRTDIWAAGATLFMALSGCIVHEGANARQVMVLAATVPARSLASVVPDAPTAVVELLAKALAYDMDARWQSAAAMRDAIAAAHESLFGPLLPEHLRTLFDGNRGVDETAPTDPLPNSNSIPVLRNSAVVSASTSTNSIERPEPTTIAQATSPQGLEATRRRRKKMMAAGLVTVIVGGTSAALYRRAAHDPRSSTPPSGSIIAPQSSLTRDSVELNSNIRTAELPSLPSSAATLAYSSSPVPRGSRSARPTATKPSLGAAPEHQPLPTATTGSLPMASALQTNAAPTNKADLSDPINHSEVSKSRRRIDDPIDHQ
jgi:serine/threonine protein kinase